jgi:hypothetical protein
MNMARGPPQNGGISVGVGVFVSDGGGVGVRVGVSVDLIGTVGVGVNGAGVFTVPHPKRNGRNTREQIHKIHFGGFPGLGFWGDMRFICQFLEFITGTTSFIQQK